MRHIASHNAHDVRHIRRAVDETSTWWHDIHSPFDLAADMAPNFPEHAMGRQGFKASAQGLGCMGMSAFYKDADHTATEKESIAVIHRAIELGVTMLDTSDLYGTLA